MTTSTLLRVRSVWISDVHLGFRGCQAEKLLDFLHSIETDYLYLVGDIVDFWSLRKSSFWPQQHTNVVRSILGKAKHGTKVIYVPGNHDEVMREYAGYSFGNVEIHLDYEHQTASGKNLLILHGDEFDTIVKHSQMIAKLGSWAYDCLLQLNQYVNIYRRWFKQDYWSLAKYLKLKVKNAVNYIGSFETALAHLAKDRQVDGVVCGHIHHAEIRHINDVLYCNDGDWVESCSSMIEHEDGSLELIYWNEDYKRTLTPISEQTAEENRDVA